MKLICFLILVISTQAFAITKIYDVKNQVYINEEDFYPLIPTHGQIIMGEYHYSPNIQKIQAKVIDKTAEFQRRANDFTVAWEFLNYPDKEKNTALYNQYLTEELEEMKLLEGLFPNHSSQDQNASYLPIFRVAKKYNAQFIGVNAPRKWKRVITKDGIEAMDPEKMPPSFELGSDNYLKRFIEAMGGHGENETLMKYYQAQCYTDSIMAWQMHEQSEHDLRFLIVGSFHSDYFDGVALQAPRYLNGDTLVLRIVDKEQLKPEDLEALLNPHPEFQDVSDYLLIHEGI